MLFVYIIIIFLEQWFVNLKGGLCYLLTTGDEYLSLNVKYQPILITADDMVINFSFILSQGLGYIVMELFNS